MVVVIIEIRTKNTLVTKKNENVVLDNLSQGCHAESTQALTL